MESSRGETYHPSGNKRAAEARAFALTSIIQELVAAGFVTQRALANEMNRRDIPTALGGSWHYTSVRRVLIRLGRIPKGRTNWHAANMRAEALHSTIHELQTAGIVSKKAIAGELNARGVPAARGGKWHPTSVTRLLQRLEKLDRASNKTSPLGPFFLTLSSSLRPSKSGHDGPMKTARGPASSRKLGTHGALANKRAADSHASALASTIRELRAAGFISRRSLADELNRRGTPTARGGKWHYTTVVRMLARQGLLTWGVGARVNNGHATKLASQARAEALAPTIAKIERAGFVSLNAIVRELNRRKIPSPQGGKWYPTSVKRLLRRLRKP